MEREIRVLRRSFKHLISYKELWPQSGAYKMKVVEVCRYKKKDPLGFSVQIGDGWDRTDGLFISRVLFGSVFDMNELLAIGEEIVKIDDEEVKEMNASQAAKYLFENLKFKIHVKVPTPFAKKRIGTKRSDREGSSAVRLVDHKILNMRIVPPRIGRHTYQEPINEEVEETGEDQ